MKSVTTKDTAIIALSKEIIKVLGLGPIFV